MTFSLPWKDRQLPDRIVEDGQRYFFENRVIKGWRSGDLVFGELRGNQQYQTLIDGSEENPEFVCTCPYEALHPCKHVLALSLALASLPTADERPQDLLRVNIFLNAHRLRNGPISPWQNRLKWFSEQEDDLNLLALWLAGLEANLNREPLQEALFLWQSAFQKKPTDLKASIRRLNLLFERWSRRQQRAGNHLPFPAEAYFPVAQQLVTDAHSAHHLRFKIEGWSLNLPKWEPLLQL